MILICKVLLVLGATSQVIISCRPALLQASQYFGFRCVFVWFAGFTSWPLLLKPFYLQFTWQSKMSHCKSSIHILFMFCASFSLHPPPILPFQRHLSSPSFTVPHCLLRAATVWPRHRHWPRPLRRPKSNILTCLLPEWWFIKKLSWLRKKIDSHR